MTYWMGEIEGKIKDSMFSDLDVAMNNDFIHEEEQVWK